MKKKLPIILSVLGAALVILGATQVWAAWQMEHASQPIAVHGYSLLQGIIAMVGGALGLVMGFVKPKFSFVGGVVALAMVGWVIANPQVAAKGGDGNNDFSFEKTEDGGVAAIEERSDDGVSDDLLALEKMAEESENAGANTEEQDPAPAEEDINEGDGSDMEEDSDETSEEDLSFDGAAPIEDDSDEAPEEAPVEEKPAETAAPTSEIGAQDPSKVEAAETNYKPAMGLWISLGGSVLLLLTAVFGGSKRR